MRSPRGLVGIIALTLREIRSDLRQRGHAERREHNERGKVPRPVVTVIRVHILRSGGVTYSVKLPDSRPHSIHSTKSNESEVNHVT